jgi:GTPase SAR1 family protein
MNSSINTASGKIKIKIVFLGNQSVGKSSIIDKYVNDKFDESSHVIFQLSSPLLASISSRRIYSTKARAIDCNFGIQQDRRGLNR